MSPRRWKSLAILLGANLAVSVVLLVVALVALDEANEKLDFIENAADAVLEGLRKYR
jgi:hypothetical protein